MPKVEYNNEYSTAYDVMTLIDKPAAGQAVIEAFFTAKGQDVYAIMPHWPGSRFVIKGVTGVKSVTLLGSALPLKFKPVQGGIGITLPDLPASLRQQPAWTLKLSR